VTVSIGEAPRRARNVGEFVARLMLRISAESMQHARRFVPRPSDVIIATSPKSGTTWMQQIVHGLRSHGDMNFSEITEVTPWIEIGLDMGWDLSKDQIGAFRAFKSHLSGEEVPAGCRYICVLRDPRDAFVSFYHFMNGWVIERDAMSPDEVIAVVASPRSPVNYWRLLVSWWLRRDESCVCITTFEDLRCDLVGEVRRIASFLGLGDDEEAIAIATRQASFEFMKAHESQFDDHLITAARNESMGLPCDARATKVRSGKVADGRGLLGDATLTMLRENWRNIVEPATGIPDYETLRASLSNSRG